MTGQTISVGQQRSGGVQPDDPAGSVDAWSEYVAAARQLDAVRRGAASAAGEQARSVQAAREELAGVRALLAPQQSRLCGLGVPVLDLTPSPPEVSAAARGMVAGPVAVLAALRDAGGKLRMADAELAATGARWLVPVRNLLVYVPLALLVPVLQVLVHLYAGGGWVSVLALAVGLPMPLFAFGAGLLLVGRLFRTVPGAPVDRTPLLGGVVCLAPALVATVSMVVLLLR
ncbi:hypothetical protein [Micromonospora echinofusca]|uniref:YIP1 family protein n=1 Tax=Micromonospora echinofusca TaxID=47858 RepID=A0ABS3VKJ0_MICEH|nr:hypothetical protein [Micromonospora echinofusca]MBO4204986.1 hypothetical protein [Micromonospora echinofusca]